MSPNGPFFKEEIQLRHTELSKQASAQLQQQHLGEREREGENLGVRMNSDRVSSRPDRQTCLEEAYTLVGQPMWYTPGMPCKHVSTPLPVLYYTQGSWPAWLVG